MPPYHMTVAAPWCLLLLAAVPLCWWWAYRPLAALGNVRRLLVLTFRTLILVGLILALADLQVGHSRPRLTVLYLLDQSLSIPRDLRREMLNYTNAAIAAQRGGDDRAGVLVFGREAAVEIPPCDARVPVPPVVESPLDAAQTNLAAAMKLAQASFPEDSARRVVLVSDGNQTQGDALALARELAAAGVSIDVLPVRYTRRAEVAVERVVVPAEIRRGQPFDVKIVLVNAAEASADDPGRVPGRLLLTRNTSRQTVSLHAAPDDRLALAPGKSVFTLRQQLDAPDFYTYEAHFVPDRSGDDVLPQNNRATAFAHVGGRGQVLIVESAEQRGEYELLASRLRRQNRDVVVRTGDQAFAELADLQPFDTVVLANVPREAFSSAQLEALRQNTQQLGAGLVMLGGANSFGAGGWHASPLEPLLPVDCQVKNTRVVPVGALLMVLDRSGSMSGLKIQMSKAAAVAAVQALSPRDWVGVLAFDTKPHWIVPPRLADAPVAIAASIARLAADGGTDLSPSMLEGHHAIREIDAAVKHMIVLSDGITRGSGFAEMAAQMRADGITVSSVAVGADAEAGLLADIAHAGGGQAYRVKDPRLIPRVFQQEVRRVSRSLVYENAQGFLAQRPRAWADHEIVRGLGDSLPALTGRVLTSRRPGALVETLLTASEPADEEVNTLLAAWPCGVGRSVAFTSDAAARWMTAWTPPAKLAQYDRLFGQMIGWSMRPLGDTGHFQLAADVAGGHIHLVVSALDAQDRLLNFLGLTATAVGPDLKSRPVAMEQIASGRYVGTLPAMQAGSYFVSVNPGPGQAPLRMGVTVPYSDEFRDRATNDTLLAELARVQPPGAPAGQVLPALENAASLKALLAVNCFRHDLPAVRSPQPVWHYLTLVACCLLLADVFVRRVQIHFGFLRPAWLAAYHWLLRRAPVPATAPHLDRLRSRKAEVAGQIEQLRAASRQAERPIATTPAAPPAAAAPSEATTEQEHYTARLLRAKKDAWKKKDEG